MDNDIWFVLRFRDKTFRKLTLNIYQLQSKHQMQWVSVEVLDGENSIANFVIEFSGTWVGAQYGHDFPQMLGNSEHSPLITNIIRELLFTRNLEDLNKERISISFHTDLARRIRKNQNGTLTIELNPSIYASENRFARELVLKELYSLQSTSGSTTLNALIAQTNYFNIAITNAVHALINRRYIEDDGKGNLRLTYAGMSFVEDEVLSPFISKIFLIAACKDEIYQLIEYIYRPAVKELKYDLIFQESNEPKGSIHDDIWEYIRECKLVICDLTFKRPNCFIEYGYALAKEKQIILCVEESEGKTRNGYIKVPFDTQNQKYSFWKKEWLTSSDGKLKLEEFKNEIQNRVKEKLSILDIASEI